MSEGLTHCTENIQGFIGRKPVFKNLKSSNGRAAYFDISFGVNDPPSGKFGTWRHCIAYNIYADKVQNIKSGSLLSISGWLTTNPVYDENGKLQLADGKPVTREYVIVNSIIVIPYKTKQTVNQLSLSVDSGNHLA